MLKADFESKLKTTSDVLENNYKAEIIKKNPHNIISFEVDKNKTIASAEIFSKQSIKTFYEQKNVIDIVINKVSITNTDINYDIFNIDKYLHYTCGEPILKYQPVYYDTMLKQVFVANYTNQNHFKKYLGISLGNYGIGDKAKIQIFGLIFDDSFNFNVNLEIYVGNGEITQDVSDINVAYQQSVGNILTEKTLYLNYIEPISLI